MDSTDRQAERDRMVAEQLIRRGIANPAVLEAMRRVPRHRFVPEEAQAEAYSDGPLAIGYGQTISQPYIVALMTELLELTPSETVLEIGTGSGYQTAILSQLARQVYTIEIVPELAERARAIFEELGYRNIQTKVGDGSAGWPEHAPFDAIIVTAAPEHIPSALLDQLALGGRLVAPLGRMTVSQRLVRLRRTPNGIEREELIPVSFVPMTGQVEREERQSD